MSTQQLYGWYAKSMIHCGTSFYLHEDRREVEVTAIGYSPTKSPYTDVTDARYIGPVTEWLRAGAKSIFPSHAYTPMAEAEDG